MNVLKFMFMGLQLLEKTWKTPDTRNLRSNSKPLHAPEYLPGRMANQKKYRGMIPWAKPLHYLTRGHQNATPVHLLCLCLPQFRGCRGSFMDQGPSIMVVDTSWGEHHYAHSVWLAKMLIPIVSSAFPIVIIWEIPRMCLYFRHNNCTVIQKLSWDKWDDWWQTWRQCSCQAGIQHPNFQCSGVHSLRLLWDSLAIDGNC